MAGGGVGTGGDLNLRGGSAEKVYTSAQNSVDIGSGIFSQEMTNHGGIAYARRGNVGQNAGTRHVFHNCGGISTLQGGQIVPYGDTGGGHGPTVILVQQGGDGQGYGNGGDGGLSILTYTGGFVTHSNNGGDGSAGVIIVEEFYG